MHKKIIYTILLLFPGYLTAQGEFNFFINNIEIPVLNKGYFYRSYHYSYNDKIEFLFSGGFFLSGKDGDSVWANAAAPECRIEDYLPGKVGSSFTSRLNRVYAIYASDPAFGDSWIQWKDAVSIGALFYDGDNDGTYNPVDLNSNGEWDSNEDRPDLLGDLTAWCVYNDSKDSNLRVFKNISPKGIEIHQTTFAYGLKSSEPMRNMVFIRYRITNTGIVSSEFDSVYFSSNTDPDLGDYYDDLVGCDTLINTGYMYNGGDDPKYGIFYPAMAIPLLQGPPAYIPNETFIDNNSNSIYNKGIDTPLDTAINNYGPYLGNEIFPGAKNLNMTSLIHHKYVPQEPKNSSMARNYMLGRLADNSLIDPCTWLLGSVMGDVNCSDVNPVFLYSGNPITKKGWIHTHPDDYRIMVNTGPFKLKANEPVDIWIAYVVSRENDSLGSLAKVIDNCIAAHSFYKTNFSDFVVGVDRNNPQKINEFNLQQNYPNPFNPKTNIGFRIANLPDGKAGFGFVTLKVFDVLGREVATLVNEEKPAGSYEVEFNASSLSSGIYF